MLLEQKYRISELLSKVTSDIDKIRSELNMIPADPPALIDVLVQDCVDREGNYTGLYVDTRGFVTVGCGHKVSTAEDAARLAPRSIFDASSWRDDWNRVSKMPKSHSPAFYYTKTSPHLSVDQGRKLCADQINSEFLPGLRRLIKDVDTFPIDAVRALLAQCYAMGVYGLSKFHQELAHLAIRDFDGIAKRKLYHIKSARPETNDQIGAWFASAAVSKLTS